MNRLSPVRTMAKPITQTKVVDPQRASMPSIRLNPLIKTMVAMMMRTKLRPEGNRVETSAATTPAVITSAAMRSSGERGPHVVDGSDGERHQEWDK